MLIISFAYNSKSFNNFFRGFWILALLSPCSIWA